MKKALLLAIAVLTVSAAQAVTYTYTNWLTSGKSASSTSGFTYSLSQATTIGTSNRNYSTIAGLTTNSAGNVLAASTLYTISSIDFGAVSGGDWGDASSTYLVIFNNGVAVSTSSAGTRMYNQYFPNAASSSTQTNRTMINYDLTTSIEATTADTFTILFVTDTSSVVLGTTTISDLADVVYSGSGAICTASTDSTAVTARVGIDEVPEPTVLAFLALGVAGLALRRRA